MVLANQPTPPNPNDPLGLIVWVFGPSFPAQITPFRQDKVEREWESAPPNLLQLG